jgi:hypothetical protein
MSHLIHEKHRNHDEEEEDDDDHRFCLHPQLTPRDTAHDSPPQTIATSHLFDVFHLYRKDNIKHNNTTTSYHPSNTRLDNVAKQST